MTIISYAKIVGGVNDGEDDVKDYSVFSGERKKRTTKRPRNRTGRVRHEVNNNNEKKGKKTVS